MPDLHTASFNDIVAELRKRFVTSIVAVQFHAEGKPSERQTRICHGSQQNDIVAKLGLAHAITLHVQKDVLVGGTPVKDDLGLDDEPPMPGDG